MATGHKSKQHLSLLYSQQREPKKKEGLTKVVLLQHHVTVLPQMSHTEAIQLCRVCFTGDGPLKSQSDVVPSTRRLLKGKLRRLLSKMIFEQITI